MGILNESACIFEVPRKATWKRPMMSGEHERQKMKRGASSVAVMSKAQQNRCQQQQPLMGMM